MHSIYHNKRASPQTHHVHSFPLQQSESQVGDHGLDNFAVHSARGIVPRWPFSLKCMSNDMSSAHMHDGAPPDTTACDLSYLCAYYKAGPSVLIRLRMYTAHTYAYRMSGFCPYNAVCSITPSIRNIRNCNIRKHTAVWPVHGRLTICLRVLSRV